VRYLKQSTAVDVAIGPFLDATDGVTAETALTISQADVRLKKNNGAWAQVNDNTSATHEENGWYEKELDATDTNTLGTLIIAVHESGALPVWHEFMVVTANWYDTMFSTDKLDVNVEEWNATSVPAEDTAGYPKVTIKDGTGTGELDLASGKVNLQATGLDLVVPSEPSAPPTWATSTILQWVAWMGALGRNKMTQTSTTTLLRNDADSGTIGTSTVSDDGTTFTRGEFS
jgi:hypothetical protein